MSIPWINAVFHSGFPYVTVRVLFAVLSLIPILAGSLALRSPCLLLASHPYLSHPDRVAIIGCKSFSSCSCPRYPGAFKIQFLVLDVYPWRCCPELRLQYIPYCLLALSLLLGPRPTASNPSVVLNCASVCFIPFKIPLYWLPAFLFSWLPAARQSLSLLSMIPLSLSSPFALDPCICLGILT